MARRDGLRVAAMVLATVGSLCEGSSVVERDWARNEYAVKAGFLFHFAQFVEWPDGAFHDAKSPLAYCTTGFDPFRGELDATLRGKVVGGRPVEVRHLKQAQDAQGCHILFIGEDQKLQVAAAVTFLNSAPVLLVGESEGFVKAGGMIGFSVEDSKVKFEVNLEAAQKAGLKINARLLTLAKTVIGGPKRGG